MPPVLYIDVAFFYYYFYYKALNEHDESEATFLASHFQFFKFPITGVTFPLNIAPNTEYTSHYGGHKAIKSSRRGNTPVVLWAPLLCGGLTGERKIYYDANIYNAPTS